MNELNHFDMVLFGATGDLAMRKLLPALYQAHAAGLLHPRGRILGVSRTQFSREEFLQKVERDSKQHNTQNYTDEAWASFVARIDYLSLDVTQPERFQLLADKVKENQSDSVVIYLSTAPKFFAATCAELAKVGLNSEKVRIVLEKPLGTDLASSQAINNDVAQYFQESQIYRIDHYLGKESLQNLLPLRFANAFLEPIWNKQHIKSVEITIAEQLGVEERGEFYDITGALRDMVQNHIMQMLCLVAMERPQSLTADAVRDEKLKVLQALRPMSVADVDKNVVRAQYVANDTQNGYLQEVRVPADSQTETYVAIRAFIDNERWSGVPFYLRTGKRLAERKAEIILNFKELPESENAFAAPANRLLITVQPDEKVVLETLVKPVGSNLAATPVAWTLDLGQAVQGRRAEAYELLLREVIDGKLALFNRRDELEAAWAWVMPILDNWANSNTPP
ncbi:MAG: glucose-6-phosphate dehydrogenase, partial [Neisseria sp.]|nr:glucose-6-phosphate dehydrogenase [Neisseria sp.]